MQRTEFGPYNVVRLLGQGGMGTVYEAIDPSTGRTVAVKTLPLHLANDEGVRRRFQSEIDTLMTLRHPGIARMIGFGDQEGVPFFAMEFVQGQTLDQLLRAGRRFTWHETVVVALEIVRVLKSAHDQGVVHRDLKPANLMFPPAAGGGFHVKLTDFGIAKLFGETGHTRSGMVIGTPEYMAPEQAAGLAVDHRADLYSLGLVMFAMLAGKPPFQGSLAEVLEWQRSRQPPRLSALVPDVPRPLDELIDRLLDKSAAGRPANATIVARQLAEIVALPVQPIAQPPLQPPPVPSRTLADADRFAAAPDHLPPTLLAHPSPERHAETVATDAGRRREGLEHPSNDATETGWSRSARSSFTTVEAATRAARERQEGAAGLKSMLMTMVALTTVATIAIAGWWLFLRPWPWPDPDAEERARDRIVAMLSDPDDLGDPCREIRSFLSRYPQGQFAATVRELGREVALDRLHKLSRHRFPTYSPKSPLERSYLEAIRISDTDSKAAADKLRGMLAGGGDDPGRGRPGPGFDDPCAAAEQPDPATWRELARRQLEIVSQVASREDAARRKETLTDKDRATDVLTQAAAYQREVETTTDATRRVVALTRRHQLLEELVETYADKPHCSDQVEEARRLLSADR
jgi:serine/threonine-protein kinase